MATQVVNISADTWTQVTTASANFQVLGNSELFVTEATSAPTDLTGAYKVANPILIYSFTRVDGNLYAYSQGKSATIAFDPA